MALLFLQRRLRVLGIPGRLGTPFLDTLVMVPWFGRDPLARGRYSFAEGRSKNSIVCFENDLALFGRRTVYFQNRTGGLVDCLGTGFGGHGPSI